MSKFSYYIFNNRLFDFDSSHFILMKLRNLDNKVIYSNFDIIGSKLDPAGSDWTEISEKLFYKIIRLQNICHIFSYNLYLDIQEYLHRSNYVFVGACFYSGLVISKVVEVLPEDREAVIEEMNFEDDTFGTDLGKRRRRKGITSLKQWWFVNERFFNKLLKYREDLMSRIENLLSEDIRSFI